MTIYCVVGESLLNRNQDRKSSPEYSDEFDWTLISPSGIIQGGNPYFIPDFARKFAAMAGTAVKIGKLGKDISPRFIDRYIDSIAPCSLFIGIDLLSFLQENGLPWSRAVSYDRCLALGRFEKLEALGSLPTETSMSIELGEVSRRECINFNPLDDCNRRVISEISKYNTLKTGDIVITELTNDMIPLEEGQTLKLEMGGKDSLRLNIR